MRIGKSDKATHVIVADADSLRALRWAGEYADYIEQPPKRRGTKCTNRKPKRKE